MRSIGVLASAIALVLCGCEVGAGDGTVPPAQVRMEASAPVVQPVLSPEAAREPGVDPSVVLPAVDTPVVVATGPTAGLQYDGSIAFRRVVK